MLRKLKKTLTRKLIQLARDALLKVLPLSEIALLLSISYTAARNLSNSILSGASDLELIKKKGLNKNDKTGIGSKIDATLLLDNSLTQKEIVDKIRDAGLCIYQPGLSKKLKEMIYSRKRLTIVLQKRNSLRTLDLRQAYATTMTNFPISKCVYLDESGFNLHITQNYGYSPINSRAYVIVSANRGQNIGLMAFISIEGVIGDEIKDGAYNDDLFLNFTRNMLISYFLSHPDSILIMDNCRFHHRAGVLNRLQENNILFKFILPYTPHLNPIEETFSELKANYRALRSVARPRLEIKNRLISLLYALVRGFLGQFEFAFALLSRALACHEFL
ncbi:hypothetical protein CDIK_2978 [Cucumispora dikerogammari]|nr:hypothetical protein CDIK_2978 [Cucumispora dikerogammari]